VALTGSGIAELVNAAGTTLGTLILDECKGISAQTNNPAKDFATIDALGKAILKSATPRTSDYEVKNKLPNDRGGLCRLSLSRCFSSQEEVQNRVSHKSSILAQEEIMGQFLLEAMGPKANEATSASTTATTTISTLRELDLTDCWFVTSSDVKALRKRFLGLHTIHLNGTRAHPAIVS